jgi:hypothetical protein
MGWEVKQYFRKNILLPSSRLKWRQFFLLKCWYIPTSPNGIPPQKTNMDISNIARTPNLMHIIP